MKNTIRLISLLLCALCVCTAVSCGKTQETTASGAASSARTSAQTSAPTGKTGQDLPSQTGSASGQASASELPSEQTASSEPTSLPEPDESRLFDFDVEEYMTLPDFSSLSLSRAVLNERVNKDISGLLSDYPVYPDKTEGTIENGDTAEIFYKGTLIIFDGPCTLTVGKSGFTALDEAFRSERANDGILEKTFVLPDNFELPSYIVRENDLLSDELHGKAVTIRLTDCPVAFPAEGESFNCNLRFEYVFPGGTYNRENGHESGYPLVIGSGSFIPGFEDGMIGMSVEPGTSRNVPVIFPDSYRNNKALSNEHAEFLVTIVKVQRKAELDLANADDFALLKKSYEKEHGEGSFTYANLEELTADYERKARINLSLQLIEEKSGLIKENDALLQEYVVKVRTQAFDNYRSYYYRMTGYSPTDDEIIQVFFGGDSSKFDAQALSYAQIQLHRHLAYVGLARKVGVAEATAEDMDKRLQDVAADYAGYGYQLTPEEVLRTVYMNKKSEVEKEIFLERFYDFLAKNMPLTD